MRKINKVKNLSGLLDLVSIPQYQNGGYIQEYNVDDIIPNYSKGGIHIKKKNRGKFTKSAKQHGMGVQEYARKVVNDPNATTLQKRRAQFAINAKKFKH